MKIVFLQAPVPLTKTYTRRQNGALEKSSYPHASQFTSIEKTCPDMKSFADLLTKHAALGHTLLKGLIAQPLVNESRKGSTDSNGQTDWIVFDFDGLPPGVTVDSILKDMKLDDISYVAQYSASYGIESMDLRAHVFMQLNRPMAAPLLKQWLIDLNHQVDTLKNAMRLTRTATALSWPLDITACQNDKLIFIAPPILHGIKDPMGKKPRIAYVAKKNSTLTITTTIPTTETNRDRTAKRVNELRDQTGLPQRKYQFKMVGAHQILVKPDSATVSDIKTDRGFVYFNLNGGDSWGYWHPESKPDYIFNFKGEPVYLTKELLPEYWEQLTQSSIKTLASGVMYLTFLDRKTNVYYRGTYDPTTDHLELFPARSETQVRHFAKQHGIALGDFIPEWDLIFDPQSTVRVDVNTHTINAYERTSYGKAKPRKVTAVPPTIHKILWHALGNNQEVYDHFLNWLACVFQYRTITQTAWILHGVEGTGKGKFMHKVLRPLLGVNQTAIMPMSDLNDRFTVWQKNKFVIFIDEIEAAAFENEKGSSAKLRSSITEPTVSLRDMQVIPLEYTNYANWIFSSNKSKPMMIPNFDRRYNIAVFQPVRLILSDKEHAKIDDELQAFHDYIMHRKADAALARTVIDTQDRQTMISVSETSIDVAIHKIMDEGDMGFFIDQLPSNDAYKRNALRANRVEDYREVLLDIIDRADLATGACHISRDELHVLFDYTVGSMPGTPNKFTSLLKHHRLHMSKVWIDKKSVQGITTTWAEPGQLQAFRNVIQPKEVMPPKLKIVGKKK